MQDDRYHVNRPLYLVGMVSLVFAMALFMFAGYIFTYLFCGFIYNVPAFVVFMQDYIVDNWAFTSFNANLFVFCIFFIPSIFFGWVSYWASNRMDDELLVFTGNISKTQLSPIIGDFIIQLIKFLMAAMLVVIVFIIIRWLIVM